MSAPVAARPLDGKGIVVTRARPQAAALAGALERQGARVIIFPAIDIEPVGRTAEVERALDRLQQTDWVIFTSANGVEHFCRLLGNDTTAAGRLAGRRIAAIGPATAAALAARGIRPETVPDLYQAEGLLDALGTGDWSGRRVLIPRAEKAREVLPEQLRRRGAEVEVLVVYRTVRPPTDPGPLRAALVRRQVAAVTFTSSSTVSGFVGFFDRGEAVRLIEACAAAVACIGPITAETARREGLTVRVEARRFTVDGLVSALVDHFHRGGPPAAPG